MQFLAKVLSQVCVCECVPIHITCTLDFRKLVNELGGPRIALVRYSRSCTCQEIKLLGLEMVQCNITPHNHFQEKEYLVVCVIGVLENVQAR